MIRSIILTAVAIFVLTTNCFASSYELVEAVHITAVNESLDDIAKIYMQKNTYAEREFKEFRSGIIELNPWLLDRGLKAGDELRINYWTKGECNG